jgi:hypothetical protein
MKNEKTYLILIYFTVVLFVKLIVDLIVEFHFPNYKNLKNETPFWKILAKIKDIFNIALIIVILYLLFFVKLNNLVIILMVIVLSSCIEYFLITRGYIFSFIEHSQSNDKFVETMDMYFDKTQNIFLILYVSYLLTRIFAPPTSIVSK